MSYQPPDLQRYNNGITMPVANVSSAFGALMPAPGAGRRYRIWGGQFGCYNTASPGPGNWSATLDHSGQTFARVAGSGFSSGSFVIPGGYALPPNTPPTFVGMASVANATLAFTFYYTVESV